MPSCFFPFLIDNVSLYNTYQVITFFLLNFFSKCEAKICSVGFKISTQQVQPRNTSLTSTIPFTGNELAQLTRLEDQ